MSGSGMAQSTVAVSEPAGISIDAHTCQVPSGRGVVAGAVYEHGTLLPSGKWHACVVWFVHCAGARPTTWPSKRPSDCGSSVLCSSNQASVEAPEKSRVPACVPHRMLGPLPAAWVDQVDASIV